MTRRMIGQYIQNHSCVMDAFVSSLGGESFVLHLDEDALATFTEGRLTQIEAAPLISHLIACAMCCHKVAALLRLEDEIVFDEPAARADATFDERSDESGRIRHLLSRLAARLAPFTDEQTVFAYQEDAEPEDKTNSEEHTTR